MWPFKPKARPPAETFGFVNDSGADLEFSLEPYAKQFLIPRGARVEIDYDLQENRESGLSPPLLDKDKAYWELWLLEREVRVNGERVEPLPDLP